VDSFRALSSNILDDSMYLIDGLVVDMGSGGVEFRKHTAPAGLQYGAEWDEDILFLQPETACVNTNMTPEMQVSPLNATPNSSSPGAYLVDRGGFVNINKTSPWLDPWHENVRPLHCRNCCKKPITDFEDVFCRSDANRDLRTGKSVRRLL